MDDARTETAAVTRHPGSLLALIAMIVVAMAGSWPLQAGVGEAHAVPLEGLGTRVGLTSLPAASTRGAAPEGSGAPAANVPAEPLVLALKPAPKPEPKAKALPASVVERARLYLDRLRINYGASVDRPDLGALARALKLSPRGVTPEELMRQVERKYFDRAAPALYGLGLPPEASQVEPKEIRSALEQVGLDAGKHVDPADVDALVNTVAREELGPTKAFGVVRGLKIGSPSRVPKMIGFHQAAHPVALPMQPTNLPGSHILPSRSRGTSRSSAADIAVPPNTPVLAPVTGTVAEVRPYLLYGKNPDTRIRIVSEARPEVLVTVLHVTGPTVEVGDRVEGGDQIARAGTYFPFESQIDRFAGRGPHVHVEARLRPTGPAGR